MIMLRVDIRIARNNNRFMVYKVHIRVVIGDLSMRLLFTVNCTVYTNSIEYRRGFNAVVPIRTIRSMGMTVKTHATL